MKTATIVTLLLWTCAFSTVLGSTTEIPSFVDRFCATSASSSGILECACSVYGQESTPIVQRVSNFINNNQGIFSGIPSLSLNAINTLRDFVVSEVQRVLDSLCPSANTFETCLRTNFTNSQTPLDIALKAFVSNNIASLLSDVCQIERNAACIYNITLPIGACVGLQFAQRGLARDSSPNSTPGSGNGGGNAGIPPPQEICPSINGASSCLSIQADLVCGNQVEQFFRNFGSRYLLPTCTNQRGQGLQLFNSVLLQCGIITSTDVFGAIAPLITNQIRPDIPSIISRAVPVACAGFPRDVACMNEHLGQSTNRLDRIVREIIDIGRFNRQLDRFLSKLCNQNAVSNVIGIAQCMIGQLGSRDTEFQLCLGSHTGAFTNLTLFELLPLDGASIRSQLCGPINGIRFCVTSLVNGCNAEQGEIIGDFLNLILRGDCGGLAESDGAKIGNNSHVTVILGMISILVSSLL